MPLLSPTNIWFPDATSPVAPLENAFLTMGNTVQDAILAVRDSVPLRVVNEEDRKNKFPKPRQGDRCYRVDKNRIETYYDTYSATNPQGSSRPGWYATGGTKAEAYLSLDGGVDISPNQGRGLTDQFGPTRFHGGGEDYFSINSSREIKAKIAGWYEVEFRMGVSGPATSDGFLKAMVLRNTREWPSSPPGEVNILEDEKPSRSSRQWLSGHAPRFWMSPDDWVQLGVRTINTASNVRFGNMIQSDMGGCFFRIRFVSPRINY